MSQLQKSIDLFKEMASAILAKYLANVKIMTVRQGGRPDFDSLMQQLKLLEKELTAQAVELIEESKAAGEGDIDEITAGFKVMIRETIERFIKQL